MRNLKSLFVAGASSLLIAGLALAAPTAPAPVGTPAAMPTAVVASAPMKAPPKATKDMQAVLDALGALGGKPIDTLPPTAARTQPSPADAVKAVLLKKLGKEPMPQAVAAVEDREIQSAGKEKIKIRIYTPAGKGPFPVIVYFHGGGWVIADLDTYDSSPRALANGAGAIVVSCDYRKAPENKFPAAHDDAFAAYQWVLANAASFNGNVAKVAVAGESAGGNLAINVALKARDSKVQLPAYELLVYPVAGTDMTTPSYVTNEFAKPLNKSMMEWFVKQTLATPAQALDPRIDLVHRTDLKGLPPTMVVTAEIDPLRSEGQALAKALKAQGVKTTAIDFTGVTHEFFGMGAAVAKAKDAEKQASAALKAAFKAVKMPKATMPATMAPTPVMAPATTR